MGTIVNELDFVYDRNRLNVTATRAKERFVLIVSKEMMDDSLTEVMQTEATSEGWLLFQDIKRYACDHNSAFVCELEVTEETMMLLGPAAPVRQTTRKSKKSTSRKSRSSHSNSQQGESKDTSSRESATLEETDSVAVLTSSLQNMDLVSRIAGRASRSRNVKVKAKTSTSSPTAGSSAGSKRTTISVRIIKGDNKNKSGTIVSETKKMYKVQLTSTNKIVGVYKTSCEHI